MTKWRRAVGLIVFGIGFAILLAHGLRVYRIHRGLAELERIRDSIIDGESGSDAVDRFESQYIRIREEYRAKGISHPHYEEAYTKSPMYYGAGLALVVIGALMFRLTRRSSRHDSPGDSDDPESADGNHPESSE